MQKYQYTVFADYFQFYIQDEKAKGDLSDSWNETAVENLIAFAPGTIGIGTVRNSNVPVEIEILKKEPIVTKEEWDKINDGLIEIKAKALVIAGCTDYFPDAARIKIENGKYKAKVLYKNLNKVSEDGQTGDDSYKIILWKV